MHLRLTKLTVVAGFLAAIVAPAQVVHQPTAVNSAAGSSIVFKFDWDQGRPWLNYTISVDDSGNAHFQGVGNPIDSGDSDSYSEDFILSDANRQKIFQLAGKTNFFQGNFEAKQKNLAHTGEKTLEFHGQTSGGGKAASTSTTYNYSPNLDIQELTRFFQAVATTVDFGRKLTFQYRFDKLGLDARLYSLQEMQSSHFAEELQAIEPILQKIASDPNMMHISRTTAKQLLKSIGPTAAPGQPATQP
ncbi:MAG TPA: hypothetical protein VE779_04890 [Candidatus Angelobacter sp.]|nr:hypothetical protein [Candidatus Angelobacter sp.]